MSVSQAVSPSVVSRVIGYELKKGFFQNSTPNLPQRIAVLAEANTANQANVDPAVGVEVLSAQQAGETWGFGSPIHQIMRILRPVQGGGVGNVPTIVYAQDEDVAAAAATRVITIGGTPTGNGTTHRVVINGRDNIDGQSLSFNVSAADATANGVQQKIVDMINAATFCPVTAEFTSPGTMTVTSKWKGSSSNEIDIVIEVDGDAAGMTYAVANGVSGSEWPDLTTSLDAFGEEWNTLVINSFSDINSGSWTSLQAANGTPAAKTGRYSPNLWKPFVALTGFKGATAGGVPALTAARKNEVTISLCMAPNSKGFSWEAAANVASLYAPQLNDKPHLDISGKSYPDMPVPSDGLIGDFATYVGRDTIVKDGGSTVILKNGAYQVQDQVTTYHPDGETPPQYRYVRNLNIDWNVKYGETLLVEVNVQDKLVAANDAELNVQDFIKPKQWAAILTNYAIDLEQRGLITDAAFFAASILVQTGATNPDRFETYYKYKRSPYARVISTTAEGGFTFNLTS